MSTSRPFRLVSEHIAGTRIVAFATGEAAAAAAVRLTPDADGSVIPNLPEDTIRAVEAKGFEYWQGQFWLGSRYAVIFRSLASIVD